MARGLRCACVSCLQTHVWLQSAQTAATQRISLHVRVRTARGARATTPQATTHGDSSLHTDALRTLSAATALPLLRVSYQPMVALVSWMHSRMAASIQFWMPSSMMMASLHE